MTNFVNLHNQTDFSILDSIIGVKDLFNRAKELNQSSVAITDHGTIAAAWDALKASRETGVKLIIGCECYFVPDTKSHEGKFKHIVLLAKNAIGYKNLLTLNTKGFSTNQFVGKKIYSVIDWDLLEEHKEGLVCLTACGNGIISQSLMNKDFEQAENDLLRLKNMFGENLGIEIQANNMKRFANSYNDAIDQQFLNDRLIKYGKAHEIKVVATSNAHYLKKEDHEIHDAILAIGAHQPIYSNFRLKYNVPDFYLKSEEEVKKFFSRNFGEEFAQEVCDNTAFFANSCEFPDWIDPKFSNHSGKELPTFPVKDVIDYDPFLQWKSLQESSIQLLDEDKLYLRYFCDTHMIAKCGDLQGDTLKEYQERIVEELEVFEFHGFSSYMLIVADYIQWARDNDITIGFGRGSCGGSLIAYVLGIHQADPIKYGLIFARFHNKEKSSFPDIDTDFAPSGRDKVKDYLSNKYGADHVAHVSNVNTITPKVYVRDIARVCELGGSREAAVDIGNNVADCIPSDIHSLDQAMEKLPIFNEYCKMYPEFIKFKSICGKKRAFSVHAGGFLISSRPLTGLVPIRKDKDGIVAIEYDKEKSEENGLIKMDLLGLSTLDIISETYSLIKNSKKEFNSSEIKMTEYDKKTYDLISKGNTFCVFQLGTSGGTIELCKKIAPKSINDISYVNSLARPSAKEMRSDFISTKSGKKKFELLHPNLGRAFNDTYGFGLYEESLFYLAQDIAGWSLHSADRLRKLTKEKGKNPKKAAAWRLEFIEDSVKRGIEEHIAKSIWDNVVEKFQGYGFNKSHSIMYSMISYQTAYLKAHFPLEFLLANLMAEVNSGTADRDANIEKIKKEIRDTGIKIVPPNINTSQLSYTAIDGGQLTTGLDALKFVSEEAIQDIIEKRPFKSFFDFVSRVDSKKVRANAIQALAASGCLDEFNISRKSMFLYISDYRKKLQVWLKKHDPLVDEFIYPWAEEEPWKLSEIYALEQCYLGDAFACKPADAYGSFFNDEHKTCLDVIKSKDKTRLLPVKAIVRSFFEFKIKKESSKWYGLPMIKAILEDKDGNQCSCTIFPDQWSDVQKRIKQIKKSAKFDNGLAISFIGNTNNYADDMGVILDQLLDVGLPPAVPDDLKGKKINLKTAKKEKIKNEKPKSSTELFDEIEDELFNHGLIDLDENDESN